MSLSRRIDRFAAWLATTAILLSGIPPASAGMLHGSDPFGDHADLCSAATPANPSTPNPDPGPADSKVCAHCDGGTGYAGSAWAPGSAIARPGLRADSGPRFVAVAPAVAIPADLIAAPPRGPPPLV